MGQDVSTTKELRLALILAANQVLRDEGAGALTLRRIAEAAGSSTMGIYTCFGGRSGLLEAVYLHGFELLRQALPDGDGSVERIVFAYRRFALAEPALYALMFERPLPDFDPPPELRSHAISMTFPLLVDATAARLGAGHEEATRAAYLIWTAVHGLVSIELTHTARTPLPGWLLEAPDSGERLLADGLSALLAGLTASPAS
ncbi:TetR/AcrR family transcriptional regulator [Nonomuraea sediminis]|uniref:TetR/AcrR family transcriptional regulator n=1 Tax=Nonomuraea sediminis TaxID=2835864 RepID=UPI001BDBFE27|nr:TetR/AcrR family transcriptional regulator [Nonomuraea sediminis]